MSTASRQLIEITHMSDRAIDNDRSKPPGMNGENTEEYFVELKYRSVNNLAAAALAKKLGLFSIALGMAEVLMPAQLGELVGISRGHRKFLPLLGLREIGHGVAILKGNTPTAGVRSRIPGDALDLAFLGASFTSKDSNRSRLIVSTAAVVGVAALDLWCSKRLESEEWSEARGNRKAPTTVGQTSGRQTK
jgi:ribosomal protein L30/L7E